MSASGIRHQNRIAVFNWKRNEVIWSWGDGELSGPHDAQVLEDGHILLFDNGLGRDVSRVLEIDPGRWEIDWPSTTHRGSSRLIVSETWDAGWKATLDGRAIAVEVVDDLWLGVRPGDAPGRLVLSYVPAGLASALLMSGVGLVLLALGAWRFRPTGADRQLQWLQASRYSDDSDHSGRT